MKPLSERVREFLPRLLAGSFCDADIEDWPDRIAELEAKLAEAEKDAERYRYICDCAGKEFDAMFPYQMTGRLGEYIDQAIDQREGKK